MLNIAGVLLILVVTPDIGANRSKENECVVLLHGLARGPSSMNLIGKALTAAGYSVANIGYPSRSKCIESLAEEAIRRGISTCMTSSPKKIHFVTHSLGGILVRYYFENHSLANLGHVVMLGPPNQGSHVVDRWRNVPGYRAINGPAGMQLGTDSNSLPKSLGPVEFSLGIIAGTRSVNPILSLSLPNPNDGKVHVENTKAPGMKDHLVLPYTHTFMMRSSKVISQILYYLANGRFDRSIA